MFAPAKRPDVVEKDMVKLLDWFIKVGNMGYMEDDFAVLTFATVRIIRPGAFLNFSTRSSSRPPPLARDWRRSCSGSWTRTTEAQ